MNTTDSIGGYPRSLGTLWFLYGVLRIAAAAFLVVFSATFTLMAGALLTRVPDPFAWMSFFHFLFWLVIAWCIVCAILSFMAAGALLSRRGGGPRLAALASFVSLPEIPFGIVLGVYTLLRLGLRPVVSSR
jgi:hypothetical protein